MSCLAPIRLPEKQREDEWVAKLKRDQRVENNLLEAHFSAYPLDPFLESQQPSKIARCQDLLAIGNSAKVALYNLQERRELWSCPLKLREHHSIEQLQVSPLGQVIAISFFSDERDGHIFLDGHDKGNIDLRPGGLVNRFDMINGFHFALSPSTGKIYVGDQNGRGIYEISSEFLQRCSPQFVLFNESCYVVVTYPGNQFTPNVFMYEFDFARETCLCLSQMPLIDATLDKGRMFCAFKDRITEVGLLLNHQETYPHEWNLGSHASLFIHQKYLIVSDPDDTQGLWSINRFGQERKRLLSGLVETPQLSSSYDFLTACYRNEGLHVVVMNVFETTTLKHFVYAYSPGDAISFLNGKLLIFNENNGSIYVQDYENVERTT